MTARGLCGTCANAREIETRKGSTFVLCELSKDDDRFPRYPVLPVLACPGYARGPGAERRKPSRG